MMFRFERSKDKLPEKLPYFTYGLIALCMIIFLLEAYGSTAYGKDWVMQMFSTYGFSLGGLLAGKWWTPLTSIFVHTTPEHLIFNMIALFFFGHVVEQGWGWKRYLVTFFAAGLAGDGAIVLASHFGLMPLAVPTVGASAAIFGLMAAAVLVRPFEIIAYPYIVPLPLVVVAAVYTMFQAVEFLAVLGTGAVTDIAYVSHFGGLAAGAYLGFRFEGVKRGLTILAVVTAILVAIPLIWSAMQSFQALNYMAMIRGP